MKKIMFTRMLQEDVLRGYKTQTRRLGSNGKHCKQAYEEGDIVAIAQSYEEAGISPTHKIYNERTHKWDNACDTPGWRNKMFVRAELMPHLIKITGVRHEPLQKASRDDCFAEGVRMRPLFGHYDDEGNNIIMAFIRGNGNHIITFPTPQEALAALIDMTCGKGTWASNPLCYVYDFKLLRNI